MLVQPQEAKNQEFLPKVRRTLEGKKVNEGWNTKQEGEKIPYTLYVPS